MRWPMETFLFSVSHDRSRASAHVQLLLLILWMNDLLPISRVNRTLSGGLLACRLPTIHGTCKLIDHIFMQVVVVSKSVRCRNSNIYYWSELFSFHVVLYGRSSVHRDIYIIIFRCRQRCLVAGYIYARRSPSLRQRSSRYLAVHMVEKCSRILIMWMHPKLHISVQKLSQIDCYKKGSFQDHDPN